MAVQKTKTPGIYVYHEKACASHKGGRCRCERSYRVKYRDEGKAKWSKSFKSEAEAQAWKVDRKRGQATEAQTFATGRSFNELADEFMELAKSGAMPQKSGKRYAKGTLDAYGRMYGNHVRDELGKRAASKLTARDWQLWVDALSHKGLKRNSISVTFNYVRAIYGWATAPTRQMLIVNATRGVRLPAHDEVARDRVATPEEASKLLAALSGSEKVSYALALYAGLRNVERKPLDWSDVDLAKNTIRLRVSKGGESGAGIRTLPIIDSLRFILRAEWMGQGQPITGLVCKGPKGGAPDYDSMKARAAEAWGNAKLQPVGFHECRHTFITSMIASGLNAKAVSTLAGHASIDVTFDRYGHLFPGSEEEAGAKLAAFYAGASAKAEAAAEEAEQAAQSN